jgi:hypothetical protein
MHQNFVAGDILVACDNELHVPTGYLGHSAMCISPEYIIESVLTFPYVQIVPIEDFLLPHPKYAHYRPKSPQLGQLATRFALEYWQICQQNYARGIIIPPFSFSPSIPLADPWRSIYCSKLIWLSYYYGAGYTFFNDHFLFTPEDLDYILQRDSNFELIYKHPGFVFFIDT